MESNEIVNSKGFPCGSISSLGALRGAGSGFESFFPQAAPAASGKLGFGPLGIEVEKQGFRTAWLKTGQKCQGVGLKSKAFILTFRDPSS